MSFRRAIVLFWIWIIIWNLRLLSFIMLFTRFYVCFLCCTSLGASDPARLLCLTIKLKTNEGRVSPAHVLPCVIAVLFVFLWFLVSFPPHAIL